MTHYRPYATKSGKPPIPVGDSLSIRMKGENKEEMKTDSNGQHQEQSEPQEPHLWRRFLSRLRKCGEPLRDVEEATGHKHDARESAE